MYKFMPIYIQQNSIPGGYFMKMDSAVIKKTNYVKEMYPKTFEKIQEMVDDECDRQDYAGSILFDEYPDKIGVMHLRDIIYDRVQVENSMCGEEDCQLYPDEDWLKDIIMVLLLHEMYRRKEEREYPYK